MIWHTEIQHKIYMSNSFPEMHIRQSISSENPSSFLHIESLTYHLIYAWVTNDAESWFNMRIVGLNIKIPIRIFHDASSRASLGWFVFIVFVSPFL